MKQVFGRVFRALALGSGLAALAAPALAPAATTQLETTITKTYQTTFVKDTGQSMPVTGGTLKLTLTKDGYINGYFTPADTISFITVVGGRNGSTVWFDIGNGTRTTHVTGTLQGSEIAGYAVEPNGVQYRFTAVPWVQPG